MKHTLNPETTASHGDRGDAGDAVVTQPLRSRRTLLGWMVGIAAGAFAVSFVVPAAALKALILEKPVIAVGDVFTYADGTTGGQPGQPFKSSDLPVNGSVQLFPMGKEANQDNLVQVVRIAPGDGVAG